MVTLDPTIVLYRAETQHFTALQQSRGSQLTDNLRLKTISYKLFQHLFIVISIIYSQTPLED